MPGKDALSDKTPAERSREKLSNGDPDKVSSEKPREKPGGMKQIISSLLYNSGAVQIQMPL